MVKIFSDIVAISVKMVPNGDTKSDSGRAMYTSGFRLRIVCTIASVPGFPKGGSRALLLDLKKKRGRSQLTDRSTKP